MWTYFSCLIILTVQTTLLHETLFYNCYLYTANKSKDYTGNAQEWLFLELQVNFQSLGLRLEKSEEDLTLYTLKFSVEWVPITI